MKIKVTLTMCNPNVFRYLYEVLFLKFSRAFGEKTPHDLNTSQGRGRKLHCLPQGYRAQFFAIVSSGHISTHLYSIL